MVSPSIARFTRNYSLLYLFLFKTSTKYELSKDLCIEMYLNLIISMLTVWKLLHYLNIEIKP